MPLEVNVINRKWLEAIVADPVAFSFWKDLPDRVKRYVDDYQNAPPELKPLHLAKLVASVYAAGFQDGGMDGG